MYWKPVFNLLEGHFELLVVNAHHIKAYQGAKPMSKMLSGLPDLLQHGLLKSSFVPWSAARAARLDRYRST